MNMNPYKKTYGTFPTSYMLHHIPNMVESEQGLTRAFPSGDVLYQHLDVVRSREGFSHFNGWMWLKKLVRQVEYVQ